LQDVYRAIDMPDHYWYGIALIDEPQYHTLNPAYSHHYKQLQTHTKPVSECNSVSSVIIIVNREIYSVF